MKVLQVGKYYHPYRGGMETHLRVLCEELRRTIDVEVVVANAERREVDDVVGGVPVHRCLPLATVASTALCPSMAWRVTSTDYDVLHLHVPHPVGAASCLASPRARSRPLVVTYHADVVRQRLLLHLYGPVLRRVLERAEAIVVASPNLADSEVLRTVRSKCVVIPFGIDTSRFDLSPEVRAEVSRVRERFGGAPLLLGNGRLIYYKGFTHAIDALARVPHARLLIVGTGPLRESLERQARALGVADRVTLLGHVSDVELAALYHACDAFVLPSTEKSEAFALVQLEAMTCGKPVINTNIPSSGVPFVSRDGESGLTVEPGSGEALAKAITQLLEDADLRRRLGEGGRRRVARDFTREVMAARTRSVYDEALARAR